jgi:hypothetical protein
MSFWNTPASQIDARTLVRSDALLRLAGLFAAFPALAASRLPMSALVFMMAAAWSIAETVRLARRIRGRALHCTSDAWFWLDHGSPVGSGSRESLAFAAASQYWAVVTLRLVGVRNRNRYRLVVLLPLLSRESRRRLLLALRYVDRTVSTAPGARSG